MLTALQAFVPRDLVWYIVIFVMVNITTCIFSKEVSVAALLLHGNRLFSYLGTIR